MRYLTIVQYREKNSQAVQEQQFDDAAQAQAFIDEHRAHAEYDEQAKAWKIVKEADWDFYNVRHITLDD